MSELGDHYTVVVVGSGYGAGVAASRIAATGQQVCVLERGREMLAGDFPTGWKQGVEQAQFDAPGLDKGSKTALFDVRINKEMNVLVGCGLGGTSLINANVALVPEPRVFDSNHWPAAVRAHRDTLLADGYARAERMLQPNPYPEDYPRLDKLEAHEQEAKALGRPFVRVPINVTFEDRVNAAGVPQKACVGCGNCVSGCNHWAKNTVNLNYVADAHRSGAVVFCEVTVRYVSRDGDKWRIHVQPTEGDGPERTITADVVVLGAGSLGSTEILLRSAAEGLPVSARLGDRFSANGDFLGFAYNTNRTINGIGIDESKQTIEAGERLAVGPTITSAIWYPPGQPLEDDFIIEEGAIPGLMASADPVFLPPVFAAEALVATLQGHNTVLSGADPSTFDNVKTFADLPHAVEEHGRAHGLGGLLEEAKELAEQVAREAVSAVRGSYHGAMANTQTYLVMGHDDAGGVMELRDDKLRIDWPGSGTQPYYEKIQPALLGATAAHKGIYVEEPTWNELMGHNLITVHPLGGSVMAEDSSSGAVDHRNRVFTGADANSVYEGLLVTCGASIPCPLGVNPLMTICAVAERAMTLLIEERGWG
ncbi:MAG: GMC family oxidoreductase N-terminal domain-containing protein [Deltaproteobacteria bacterium]|nr:GMC family oxidoreductase N-terminal domain-containing protein [Deltaproteobacteria bacterium]